MSRRKKSQVEWLVCGPDPYLATCQRCGGHVDKPKLPLRMEAFIKYMQYGVEAHRYCKEPKKQ